MLPASGIRKTPGDPGRFSNMPPNTILNTPISLSRAPGFTANGKPRRVIASARFLSAATKPRVSFARISRRLSSATTCTDKEKSRTGRQRHSRADQIRGTPTPPGRPRKRKLRISTCTPTARFPSARLGRRRNTPIVNTFPIQRIPCLTGSAPLDHDLTVTGPLAATLFASTSGTDSDFVVKLIDVFPENAQKNEWDAGAGPKPGEYAKSLNGYE